MQRENMIALYLTGFLNEINFEYTERKHTSTTAAMLITQKYKNILSEQINQIKRVVDCAKIMSISPNHLNKCVKEVTGKSAHELLLDMRILEAKVLLKQTDLRIAEIAFQLGG